jgi:FkbM family methyltransferase
LLSFIQECSIWETLREEKRPILMYGMGDGALKILAACRQNGIPVQGIFVSDDHLRRRDFAGFPLKSLSEMEAEYGDFVILLCFAAFREDLLAQIERVAERHTLLAPDVPVFGEGLFDSAFVDRYEGELQAAYDLMADSQSRAVFEAVVNFKLSGKPSWLKAVETPREEMYQLLQVGREENYYDLGGYDGDTIREFRNYTEENFSSITVLEPDTKNFRKLENYVKENPDPSIRLVQAASWKEDGFLSFHNLAGRNSFLGEEGKTVVPARSVDSLAGEIPVTFIKMDVEGAELETLYGAEGVLRRDAPKLLIAAYHRNEDLFRLPLSLHQINPNYRIYLRRQPYIPAWETNLCARI